MERTGTKEDDALMAAKRKVEEAKKEMEAAQKAKDAADKKKEKAKEPDIRDNGSDGGYGSD
jgi:hypothetical protein